MGWVLRLRIDEKGVSALGTHVAELDASGTPTHKPDVPSPCWMRGQPTIDSCLLPR